MFTFTEGEYNEQFIDFVKHSFLSAMSLCDVGNHGPLLPVPCSS